MTSASYKELKTILVGRCADLAKAHNLKLSIEYPPAVGEAASKRIVVNIPEDSMLIAEWNRDWDTDLLGEE